MLKNQTIKAPDLFPQYRMCAGTEHILFEKSLKNSFIFKYFKPPTPALGVEGVQAVYLIGLDVDHVLLLLVLLVVPEGYVHGGLVHLRRYVRYLVKNIEQYFLNVCSNMLFSLIFSPFLIICASSSGYE